MCLPWRHRADCCRPGWDQFAGPTKQPWTNCTNWWNGKTNYHDSWYHKLIVAHDGSGHNQLSLGWLGTSTWESLVWTNNHRVFLDFFPSTISGKLWPTRCILCLLRLRQPVNELAMSQSTTVYLKWEPGCSEPLRTVWLLWSSLVVELPLWNIRQPAISKMSIKPPTKPPTTSNYCCLSPLVNHY